MNRHLLVFGIIFLFIGMSFSSISGIQINNQIIKPFGRGNTLYVGGNGTGNYTTIQSAIDDAFDCDTVFVFDDNSPYHENLIVDKSINLIGEDRDTTIINGSEISNVITVFDNWVNISGFTIQYGYQFGIRIYSNNITITGNTVSNNFWGIYFDETSGNNIIGNNISNNDIGLYLSSSISNKVIGNNISNNRYGILLSESSDSAIKVNTMVGDGIFIRGDMVEYWTSHVIDTSNTVNGKPIIYWKNQIGGTIPNGAGQVILANCSNVVIENQNVSSCFCGIELGFSSDCIIIGNIASNNNRYGIHLEKSYYNKLTDNIISNNYNGISLDDSSDNTITDNNIISNSWYGISIEWLSSDNNIEANNILKNRNGITLKSNDNNIIGNNISKNENGILLWDSGNTITGNNISNNSDHGILLWDSDNNIIGNNITNSDYGIYIWKSGNSISGNNIRNNDYGIYIWNSSSSIIGNTISNNTVGISLRSCRNNVIYHNNIIENTNNVNVFSDVGKNTWNDGKYGNYWSDYEERYPDAKPKLFKPWMWDTPYEIKGENNTDNCPLVKQWPNSASIDISRNKVSYNSLFQRFLDRFPLLLRLLDLWRDCVE